MTKAENSAMAEGYNFSGVYTRDKEEAKERADEKRKEGYKARVIFEPSSRLSRGPGGGGYSVFIKPTENKIKELEAEKVAKEEKRLADLKSIKDYFLTRTGEELVELFLEAKDGEEWYLMSWAKTKNIIT